TVYRDLTSLPARNDSRGLLFAGPRVICFGVPNFAALLFGISLFDVVVFVDKPDQFPVFLFYSWRFLGFVCIGNRSSRRIIAPLKLQNPGIVVIVFHRADEFLFGVVITFDRLVFVNDFAAIRPWHDKLVAGRFGEKIAALPNRFANHAATVFHIGSKMLAAECPSSNELC